MITVRRVMGIETEYALIDRDCPQADPQELATDLLYAYATHAAAQGSPSTRHVPSKTDRSLARGAGTRFDYSGELPQRDARDGQEHDLLPEARTDLEAGAVLTGSPARWIHRVDAFGQHYYRGTSTQAANGARLYVDHTHPEYASPEVLGPVAAATYDRAGDRLMHEAEQALSAERGTRVQVIKNNTDGRGSAWGAHESYAVARESSWELLTDILLPLLVSRLVVCGSGRVGVGAAGEEPGFQILARADYVEQPVSLYTTRNRPIVNTRDEPHADARQWRRLHVITADSSTLEVSAVLRLGLTACVLSLVEQAPQRARALADRLALADPVEAIKVFSYDTSLRARCPLVCGGKASALEIQWDFLEEVESCLGEGTVDEETALVLALWREALEALDRGPGQAAQLVEWCAKLTLLERLRERAGCGWDDPRMRAADLQFAVVDPASSLAARLERAGQVRRLLEDDAVAAAVTQAPDNTRAGGRAAFLRLFPEQVWAASWTSLVLDTGETRLLRVTLPDPLHPTGQEVEQAYAGTAPDAPPVTRLLATLEALGLDVPAQPETFGWDEGFYATAPASSAATDAGTDTNPSA
ncbi:Pup deamidase/depupylase [Actinomyces bovis]|uniref:Pup deamidase/depupylase n=1 Tax=Actinomyces bovis TaxID=1658 RepID=A0ABY1VMN4_9ACTO|nr:proteasome accessory factor PafA2 family protein [Actinomyces bovis]SPT53355.1 Pup deamidase/depupylase [Actinomyces bovis]VEG52725.1 Pup deamidase/depupylase [Actinomyces israelii]